MRVRKRQKGRARRKKSRRRIIFLPIGAPPPQVGYGSNQRTDAGHRGEPKLTAEERAAAKKARKFSQQKAQQQSAANERRRQREREEIEARLQLHYDRRGNIDANGEYDKFGRYIGPPPRRY